MAFDLAPARGVVRITLRQGTERVQVVREDHDGVDAPGMVPHAQTEAGSQQVDVLGQQTASSVRQIEGKEPGGARGVVAAVVGHPWPPCRVMMGFASSTHPTGHAARLYLDASGNTHPTS
ncbi:hypothetical protein D3C78_1667040 [compost metagenome]